VEAERALKAALQYLPDDIHSLNNLAVAYYLSGQRRAAIRQFRQVLARNRMMPGMSLTAGSTRLLSQL
jgi:Flp pilus assembly protein TadD